VERDLIPPDPRGEPSDRHRTAIAPSGASWQAVGRVLAGPQQGGGLYPPHGGATHPKQAVGRVWLRAKLLFSIFSFTEHSF
jgi:hypothetical protein